MNNELWNINSEILFFKKSLENFLPIEKLFYYINGEYYAYIPNNTKSDNYTLQSRNSLIGKFTENWIKNLIDPIARKYNLFAINGVICDEISLSSSSSADLALCTTNEVRQKAENIKIIFEVKMSIVSNYLFKNNTIKYFGDYKTHKGIPSLLRSDSMLKAIGKSVNIRISSDRAKNIPIIVIGNTPITKGYINKVDYIKKSGIIQNFISINPNPTNSEFITNSYNNGFITIQNIKEFDNIIYSLLDNKLNYFSSMISHSQLGKIISISNKEDTEIKKAKKFLELLNMEI